MAADVILKIDKYSKSNVIKHKMSSLPGSILGKWQVFYPQINFYKTHVGKT